MTQPTDHKLLDIDHTESNPIEAPAPPHNLAESFYLHRWLLLYAGIYTGSCAGVLHWQGYSFINFHSLLSCAILYLAIPASFVLGQAAWVVLAVRPSRPLSVLTERLRTSLSATRRLSALPILLLIGPFTMAFGQAKSLLAVLHPHSWDTALAHLDVWLHFGVQPWQWLEPWLLNGPVVSAVTLVYTGVWFFVGLGVLAYASLEISRPKLRMQFLLSYFAIWSILGTFAAIAFSSAGPVYYADFGIPPDTYTPLLDQLRQLDAQGWLTPMRGIDLVWRVNQLPGIAPPGLGISAMPSMHVAMTCLIYLYSRAFGPVIRSFALAYLVTILIGSVLLGWHFAVDGYAAIIGTLLIWWAAGRIARSLS